MKLSGDVGIGIDIIDVKRFKKIPYESHKKFYQRIFSMTEIKYCLKFKDPYKHFAGKFAIKEAVKKSIGDDVDLIDIETAYSNSKPTALIKSSNHRFFVSVSHEQHIAVAVVISQKV